VRSVVYLPKVNKYRQVRIIFGHLSLTQIQSIDHPTLGQRGFTGSITYSTTRDFGEPADASWRCGDFTRHDITLINLVDELVGCPGGKNCSIDRGVDDRRSPKDFASFVQDWLKNILFLCSVRLNICITIKNK
jgi:hypothetical protein